MSRTRGNHADHSAGRAGQDRILAAKGPGTGKSANVDLIPLGGPASGGSQVSLPALQALGASLTDLPTIEVWVIATSAGR